MKYSLNTLIINLFIKLRYCIFVLRLKVVRQLHEDLCLFQPLTYENCIQHLFKSVSKILQLIKKVKTCQPKF